MKRYLVKWDGYDGSIHDDYCDTLEEAEELFDSVKAAVKSLWEDGDCLDNWWDKDFLQSEV